MLVYMSESGQFKVEVPKAPASAKWVGEWFDPRSGQRQPLPNVTIRGTQAKLVPPMGVYDAAGDVALRLWTEEA